MVQLLSTHGAQVKLESLKVHDEGVGKLLDGATPLGGHALLALFAEVAVVPLVIVPQFFLQISNTKNRGEYANKNEDGKKKLTTI